MDVLRQDLGFAVRSMATRRSFTFIAVITLALGIGATTSIFSVVRGILLRPLPFSESDRILMVWQGEPGANINEGGLLSHPNFADVQSDASLIESIAQYGPGNLTVSIDGAAELVPGARVTPRFLHVFRAPLEAGREFLEEEDRPGAPDVVILSGEFWRDRLGARDDVLGSIIRINGAAHTVVGITAPGFSFPNGARMWVPSRNDDASCGRGCVGRRAAARLAPGATVAAARAQLAGIAGRLEEAWPETNDGVTLLAAPLRDVIVGDVRPALRILLGAVLMVLLIACANVANLLLVRGSSRQAEIAVRATLGADRGRLVHQLLTESLLLASIGGLLGIILAAWGIDILRNRAPSTIPRLAEVAMDPVTLGFAVLMVASTALLFGLAPALHLSRVDLAGTLRQGGRGDVNGGRPRLGRSAILAAQVALSVMLLLAAGLMVRSLVGMTRIDPGFDADGVTLFRLSLPDARYEEPGDAVIFMNRLRERIAAMPGIEEAAIMVGPPLSGTNMFGNFTRLDVAEPEPADLPSVDYRIVDEHALDLLRIPVVAGRGFTDADTRDGQQVALIGRRAAERYFPAENPVGKMIDVAISAGYGEDAPRMIVGVFEDPRASQLTAAPAPALYIPYAQSGATFPSLLMRGRGTPSQFLAAARRELRALDAELPMVQPGVMSSFVDRQLAQPRFYLLLLGIFAFLAVVLAAVGMYGVVAYAVARRTREIGVRMALGARVQQVVRLVLWQGLRPAIIGIVAGCAAAGAAGRIMSSLLFGIAPQDPLTFVAVPALLAAVVLGACALPARRASRIPPATALRSS